MPERENLMIQAIIFLILFAWFVGMILDIALKLLGFVLKVIDKMPPIIRIGYRLPKGAHDFGIKSMVERPGRIDVQFDEEEKHYF
jgi:hypothetical protein